MSIPCYIRFYIIIIYIIDTLVLRLLLKRRIFRIKHWICVCTILKYIFDLIICTIGGIAEYFCEIWNNVFFWIFEMAALFADNDLQTEYVVERPKTAIIAIMLFIVLFIIYVISSLSLSLSLSLSRHDVGSICWVLCALCLWALDMMGEQ